MSTAKDRDRNAYLVQGLKDERMKTFAEAIAVDDNRIKFLYEAPADTKGGQQCLKTEFVYIGTSSAVLYSRETPGVWLASFDTDAAAKATADGYTLES